MASDALSDEQLAELASRVRQQNLWARNESLIPMYVREVLTALERMGFAIVKPSGRGGGGTARGAGVIRDDPE